MAWTLYEIECGTPGHIYVGISRAPDVRIWHHKKGEGALFTRRHGVKSFRLLGDFPNEKSAKAGEEAHCKALRRPDLVVAGGGDDGPDIRVLNKQKQQWERRAAAGALTCFRLPSKC